MYMPKGEQLSPSELPMRGRTGKNLIHSPGLHPHFSNLGGGGACFERDFWPLSFPLLPTFLWPRRLFGSEFLI